MTCKALKIAPPSKWHLHDCRSLYLFSMLRKKFLYTAKEANAVLIKFLPKFPGFFRLSYHSTQVLWFKQWSHLLSSLKSTDRATSSSVCSWGTVTASCSLRRGGFHSPAQEQGVPVPSSILPLLCSGEWDWVTCQPVTAWFTVISLKLLFIVCTHSKTTTVSSLLNTN